jgi:SAM-dependent methyltransferase
MKGLKTAIRKIRYSGSNYYCPVCNYNAAKFIDGGVKSAVFEKYDVVGGGFRKNLICPSCLSSDRERLMYLFVEKTLKEIKQANNNAKVSIMHLAPEHQISAWLLKQPGVEYTAGDKFTKGYEYPDYTIDLDILKMPFEDNKFDLLICNHVLEHIPDDMAAMKEIQRVLKKGGIAVLQVPLAYGLETTAENPAVVSEAEREEKYGQYDHVRLYGLDYSKRLEKTGFKVVITSPNEFINANNMNKYSVNAKENVYSAIKS